MDRPIDVDAVRADDDLIEALAAGLVPPPTGRPEPGDIEAELVALLAGWVADVRPETLLYRPDDTPTRMPRVALRSVAPSGDVAGDALQESAPTAVEAGEGADAPAVLLAESATTRIPVVRPAGEGIVISGPWAAHTGPADVGTVNDDDATAAIPITPRRRIRRPRTLYRAAAAAAFVALAASGTVAGSYDAKPGGVLWPVTRIVFAEKARSVQAATDVTTGLARARKALRDGQTAEAKAAFKVVIAQLPSVDAAEGQDVLMAQSSDLAGELGVAPPGSPAGSVDTIVSTPPPPTGRVLASGAVGAWIDAQDLPVPAGPRTSPEPPRLDPAASGSDAAGSAPAGSAPAGTAPADSLPADSPAGTPPAGPTRPSTQHPGGNPLAPDLTPPTGPTTDGATTNGPTSGGPTSGGPTSGGPTSGGPTSGGPTSGGTTGNGPATDGHPDGGPTTGGPTTSGPTNPGGGTDTPTPGGQPPVDPPLPGSQSEEPIIPIDPQVKPQDPGGSQPTGQGQNPAPPASDSGASPAPPAGVPDAGPAGDVSGDAHGSSAPSDITTSAADAHTDSAPADNGATTAAGPPTDDATAPSADAAAADGSNAAGDGASSGDAGSAGDGSTGGESSTSGDGTSGGNTADGGSSDSGAANEGTAGGTVTTEVEVPTGESGGSVAESLSGVIAAFVAAVLPR